MACPVHKRTFSLESGRCLGGDDYTVRVFPVKVEADDVYLQLPPAEQLDAVLATAATCNGSCAADAGQGRPQEGLPGRRSKGYDPFKVGLFEDPV